MKITRTIGKLHFEDLDPQRFEDLITAIIYRQRRWLSIHPYGKMGNEGGIDLKAIEELENGKSRTWHFQYKRYAKLRKNDVLKIIDEYTSKNFDRPDIYVLITSCEVSKITEEALEKHAKSQGFAIVQLMTRSWIETILYSERHDLLFAYFGISLTEKRIKRADEIRRNIALKKRMRKDFLDFSKSTPMEHIKDPTLKFVNSEVLIRSIDDNTYPKGAEYGVQKCYKAETYDFYYNGIVVVTKSRKVILKTNKEMVCFELGYIPYSNIIDYDNDGDGHYMYPHLFCDFTNVNDPYEKIGYCYRSDGEFWSLDDEDILQVE